MWTYSPRHGINEWSQADAMKLMNPGYDSEAVGGSLYWNKQNGKCYNEQNNASVECDFTKTGLKDNSKKLIANVKWNVGSNGTKENWNNIKASTFYELERGKETGKICGSDVRCNDTVERFSEWIGYVGLVSPSDYGYATSGGFSTNRGTCLNTALISWNTVIDCYNNNFLYKSGIQQWTIMPAADTSNANFAFHIFNTGYVTGYSVAKNFYAIFPSLHLKSNVQITSGDGTKENAYKLEMVGV